MADDPLNPAVLALDPSPAVREAVRRELLGEAAALKAQAEALVQQARAKETLAAALRCPEERTGVR